MFKIMVSSKRIFEAYVWCFLESSAIAFRILKPRGPILSLYLLIVHDVEAVFCFFSVPVNNQNFAFC